MKKVYLLIIVVFAVAASALAKPDEGMWLPLYIKQLNMDKMKELGLKLTAEDIYSINHSSLKDAVLRLGRGFCTGELVSPQGLVFTNHHCGYDAIAELSTVENDFLTEGFWARSLEEEIPIPNMTVSRLVYMVDLTPAVDSIVKAAASEEEAENAKKEFFDKIKADSLEGTHYEAEIKSMFSGLEYYMMVYETFQDVRFVAAPPSSIGKFGGDTDNWMWPRHTGDFSILRVYVGPDGKPAPYSKDNVPYKPLKYFEISLDGLHRGDFAMIMGYPGNTQRYLSSYDIKYKQNVENPALITIFDEVLKNMKEAMDADPQTRLELASDYAGLANFYKYTKGVNEGLKRFKLIDKYLAKEKEITEWITKSPERIEKYGDIFNRYENAYKGLYEIMPSFYYSAVGLRRLSTYSLLRNIYNHYSLLLEGNKISKNDSDLMKIKESWEKLNQSGTLDREKKSFKLFAVRFLSSNDKLQESELVQYIQNNYQGKTLEDKAAAFIDELLANSIIFNEAKTQKFFNKPSKKILAKDKLLDFYKLSVDFVKNNYVTFMNATNQINELYKDYIELQREWNKDKVFYPDANSTLRLTYGTVRPYFARDAVFYNYYTTYKGILEKEIPGDEEFDVHPRLKELLLNKDFGPYAENDTLRLCFLTDNDITGGNSGSPVLNDKGQLVGIAFDGNWEAMIGDLVVDPVYNRTISVDIRYVLFVIDKFANAQNLIHELTLVSEKNKTPEEASVE